MVMQQTRRGMAQLGQEPNMTDIEEQLEEADSWAAPLQNKRRKVYLCGKCGQPKRGHICPIPSDDEDEDEQQNSVAVMQAKCGKCSAVMELVLPQSIIWIQCHSCSAVWRIDPSYAYELQASAAPALLGHAEMASTTDTGGKSSTDGVKTEDALNFEHAASCTSLEAVDKSIGFDSSVKLSEQQQIWDCPSSTHTLSGTKAQTLGSDDEMESLHGNAGSAILGHASIKTEAEKMVMSFFTQEESMQTVPFSPQRTGCKRSQPIRTHSSREKSMPKWKRQ